MKKHVTFILLILSLLVVQAVNAQDEMIEFSLPVGFVPNVQFAPLYAALENGFFAEENLAPTLDHSLETDTVALVGAGRIPFGVCSGEQVLLGRNQGMPIVYVADYYQRFPIGIAALKSSGINSIEDLHGRKVGTPVLHGANYIGLEAILQHFDMSDKDVSLEVIGYTAVEMLSVGKVDAAAIYINNETEQLRALGYDINVFPAADYVTMVSNGLITNEQTIRDNPELVARMTRAFVRGIKWVIEHPEEAYQICLKYVDGLADAENQQLQQNVLNATIELSQPAEGIQLGQSDPQSWQNMAEVMRKMGLISSDMDPQTAYTNQFIEQLNQ